MPRGPGRSPSRPAPGRRLGALRALLVTAMVGLAACTADSTEVGLALTDARADPDAEGEVQVTGSSTVEPISVRASEAFRAQNGKVDISVEGPGTGDGFVRFCAGEADVAGASRPIKDTEVADCAARGIDVIELRVGLDGVVVITSPDNDVECLSFADLYALVGPEAKGIDDWPAARPLARQLGSDTRFPDLGLTVIGPGQESGTYDSFVELVTADVAEARAEEGEIDEGEVESLRPDYAATANDNAIVASIGAERGGLGWVGFAFADQTDEVRAVPVSAEPDGECVEPTAEAVRDGSYPISRELFIYVSADAAEREAVAAFVDFYLAGLDDFVSSADYVTLDDDAFASTEARWADRTIGPAGS